MAAKLIQVSDDGGSTWNTIPGPGGEFSSEGETIDDTILGQVFSSTEAGLIGWSISTSAFFKGFAGYNAAIKQQGTSTAMTSEATTNTTGNSYQIDDVTKRIWDRSATFTFSDGGGVIPDSEVESINYLTGTVTFNVAPTPPVTVDGNYFPTVTLGTANTFTQTQTAEAIDNTDFATAQGNGGYRTFEYGLKTVEVSLSGFYDATNAFKDELAARNEIIIEIDPRNDTFDVSRGFFRLTNQSQSGDVGALEEEEITASLNVPTGKVEIPYTWVHDDAQSTLPTAVRILLDAWENETTLQARYLPDGIAGVSGSVIVTDMSMSSGLDDMVTFEVTLQGSGSTTAV